jgi:hypothetical protein
MVSGTGPATVFPALLARLWSDKGLTFQSRDPARCPVRDIVVDDIYCNKQQLAGNGKGDRPEDLNNVPTSRRDIARRCRIRLSGHCIRLDNPNNGFQDGVSAVNGRNT